MTEIDFVVGDRVVTSRGIYGTIVSIDESADTSKLILVAKLSLCIIISYGRLRIEFLLFVIIQMVMKIIIGLLHFLNSLNYMILLSH